MAIKTYDPNELSIIIGTSPIVGFEEDSGVAIEFEDPQYEIHNDVHGNVARFRQNKNIGKVTLNLTQTSASNDVLSSWLEADRINNGGIFPVMIKDNSGTTLVSSTAAYIEQLPSIEFGNENKTREWVIILTNATKFVGGVK